MENEGKFPKRRQLGANSVGWIESEVQEWIAERPQVGLVNDIAIPALDKEAKSQERAKI